MIRDKMLAGYVLASSRRYRLSRHFFKSLSVNNASFSERNNRSSHMQ
jgi:hypothetical protein